MNDSKHLDKDSPKPQLADDVSINLFSMRFCPYAHRVHLVLEAKRISYHALYINLSQKPEWFTDFSPQGKVPAVQLVKEDGKPILTESLVICEYLDEKYPTPALFPKDPLKKALDKILIQSFSTVIGHMYKVFIYGIDGAPGSLTEVTNGLDIYEKELQTRHTTYFGGDEPGMVDFMIWPWCERSAMLKHLLGDVYAGEEEDRFPYLLKWRDNMIALPAVKSFYLDGETHAKHILGRRLGNPDYDMLINSKRPRVS